MENSINRRRGQILALLSLVATAGVPVLVLLVRLNIFTFPNDFTGFNSLGFVLKRALLLLVAGAVLSGLAWRADRRSWLVRSAVVINGVPLAGLLWLLLTFS